MINIIRIKKITFYGYHGVFKEEQNIGGKFEADIDIYTDFKKAADTDNLTKTVNYEQVMKMMLDISNSQKYHLIEALGMKIVDELFRKFQNIEKIAIRVRKNNPPIGGLADSVEIEIIKSRQEFNGSADGF